MICIISINYYTDKTCLNEKPIIIIINHDLELSLLHKYKTYT